MKSLITILLVVASFLFYYGVIHWIGSIKDVDKTVVMYTYCYLIVLNVYGLIIMLLDKSRSRNRSRRISERHLFVASALGGSLGTMMAMFVARHKTKHLQFRFLLPVFFIVHLIVFIEEVPK